MLKTLDRYWQTLRHLRPVQFYGRLWFRLARPRPDLSPAPPVRVPDGAWLLPACREPSLAGPRRFVFLGEADSLDAVGWDGPAREKLWRYNQHYFDDLNALDGARRAAWHHDLLLDWLAQNPPGSGNGWEPYPVSLRIVNWMKWALVGNALPEACVHSLAVQARWLARRLEIHLLGNHLFANAKALVFAGCFFSGPEADQWLEKGLSILAREIPEQILFDGGHFERSTMYHALALEDMLDLYNLLNVFSGSFAGTSFTRLSSPPGSPFSDAAGIDQVFARWAELVKRMLRWLDVMCHPDGELSFFNDAAFGVAPAWSELHRYASSLGIRDYPAVDQLLTSLPDSGYVRLQTGAACVLLDVAPVGPDYLPGHAHADTLSFEMSLFGQRLLVNSGTSRYGVSEERLRQRGTAAHNTVVVDGKNSSEVWGGFRVARRARPVGLSLHENLPLSVICSHDGYRWLTPPVRHQRKWQLSNGELTVEDWVVGGDCPAEARYHFHPDVALIPGARGNEVVAQFSDGHSVVCLVDTGNMRIEPSTWHPAFGTAQANCCLVVALTGGRAALRLTWSE